MPECESGTDFGAKLFEAKCSRGVHRFIRNRRLCCEGVQIRISKLGWPLGPSKTICLDYAREGCTLALNIDDYITKTCKSAFRSSPSHIQSAFRSSPSHSKPYPIRISNHSNQHYHMDSRGLSWMIVDSKGIEWIMLDSGRFYSTEAANVQTLSVQSAQ